MNNNFARLATTIAPAIILLLLINVSNAAVAGVDTFVGPGVMECDVGQCSFSVDPGLGCADPCHTLRHQHMFDLAFKHVAEVSSNVVAPGGRVCYKKQAKNINSYFPDEYVTIEKGCTAKCTGCSFSPTKDICKSYKIFICTLRQVLLASLTKLNCHAQHTIAGPANINCRAGRCFAYTDKNFKCGNAIASASKDWGSFHTLAGGDDDTHSFHGYEHINTNGPITIPKGCNLECSRCNKVANAGLRNFRMFRGNDPN